MPEDGEEEVGVGAAARLLGISRTALREGGEDWGLRMRRTFRGGHRRYVLRSVQRFLDSFIAWTSWEPPAEAAA